MTPATAGLLTALIQERWPADEVEAERFDTPAQAALLAARRRRDRAAITGDERPTQQRMAS